MSKIFDRLVGYDIQLKCSNCQYNTTARVPRGILVEDYLKSSKCSNCGCLGKISLRENIKGNEMKW